MTVEQIEPEIDKAFVEAFLIPREKPVTYN